MNDLSNLENEKGQWSAIYLLLNYSNKKCILPLLVNTIH